MRFTREDADQLAELMLSKPNTEFRLMSDGILYMEIGESKESWKKGMEHFKPIKRLGVIPSWVMEDEGYEMLWDCKHEELLHDVHYRKFRYKTHLSDYLYHRLRYSVKMLKGRIVKPSGHSAIDGILSDGYHWDYRTREPLELTEVKITKDRITVKNNANVLVDIRKQPKVDYKDLMELYEEVKEEAEHNSRVVVNNERSVTKKEFIEGKYSEYEKEYEEYVNNFNVLKRLWEWKVREDGFYEGFEEDRVYTEVLKKLGNNLMYQGTGGALVGRMNRVNKELLDYKRMFKSLEDRAEELTVYL